MSQVYIRFALAVSFSFQTIYGFPDDPTINGPAFQLRNGNISPLPSQFQANNQPQKQIYHANANKQIPPTTAEKPRGNNITFSELMEALKGSRHREDQFLQPVGRENDGPYASYSPYGYTRPGYETPPVYHNSGIAPEYAQPKTPLMKPDLFGLLHPVTAKVSDKLSGLLGLVTALLSGSSSEGMMGMKGLLINGILKPLLLAKGGIKALITKLMIPVVALLLINVEVLVVVWWLWEECPENVPQVTQAPCPSYVYQKPPAENQKPANNYESYS